jgi:hypothetical protein
MAAARERLRNRRSHTLRTAPKSNPLANRPQESESEDDEEDRRAAASMVTIKDTISKKDLMQIDKSQN